METRHHLLSALLSGSAIYLKDRREHIFQVLPVVGRHHFPDCGQNGIHLKSGLISHELIQQIDQVCFQRGMIVFPALKTVRKRGDKLGQNLVHCLTRIIYNLNVNYRITPGEEIQGVYAHIDSFRVLGNVVCGRIGVWYLRTGKNLLILLQHNGKSFFKLRCGNGGEQAGGGIIPGKIPIHRRYHRHDVIGVYDVMDIGIIGVFVRHFKERSLRRLERIAVQIFKCQSGAVGQFIIIQISGNHIGHCSAAAVAYHPYFHTSRNIVVDNIFLKKFDCVVTSLGKPRMRAGSANCHIASPFVVIFTAADRQRDQCAVRKLFVGGDHADGFCGRRVDPELILGKILKTDFVQQFAGILRLLCPDIRLVACPGGQFKTEGHGGQTGIIDAGVIVKILIAVGIVHHNILFPVVLTRKSNSAPCQIKVREIKTLQVAGNLRWFCVRILFILWANDQKY